VQTSTYTPPPHGFRTFVIVWAAQSLSVVGSGMTGFALNVYLAQVLYPAPEQKAELALAFTALNLGFTIPFVFGGPLAGAWADRHDRKQIMIATNLVNGLTTVLTLVLMLAGSLQVWMLVAIGIFAAAARCPVPAEREQQHAHNRSATLRLEAWDACKRGLDHRCSRERPRWTPPRSTNRSPLWVAV